MLADDSVTAQNMGRKILADAGYEVITVNNGSAALKKIAEHKPDLIVLDVYMPGYSGLEVCQRLKEAQETSRVPVLLTVGKLEPFKPEEAKRVRADGFIVKPFEASELLSALSKLEDKIVPRPEGSKPGRFARATAAIDEGRYDKTVAVEEDSGWKNRIAFPSKKKKATVEEDGDDPAIYNAINKDLRTVVEHKPAESHKEHAEESRVDLGALAPEGLPKDVTPEEIAALAAAAAQVKGKLTESTPAEPALAEAHTAETKIAEAKIAETKIEEKPEGAEPAQPAAEHRQEITAAAPPAATLAEQKSEEKSPEKSGEKSEEKIAASAENRGDAPKEAGSPAVPSPADVMAAIAGLESGAGALPGAGSGNGSWSHAAAHQTADEPVTMAAAAGAGHSGAASRWTAVSVALAPDEAALSLEHEMHKTYAAFAAAEHGHSGFATAIPPMSADGAPASATSLPAVVPEPVVAVPATPAPEAVQPLSALASAATEALGAAVKEFETVAASYLQERQEKTSTPVEPEAAPIEEEKTEAAAQPAPEAHPFVEARTEESPAARSAQPEPETSKLETVKPDEPETSREEPKDQRQEENNQAPAPLTAVAVTASEEIAAEPISAGPVASEVPVAPAEERPAEGSGEAAKKETDMAATTAAAWASWRRVRESGDSKTESTEPSRNQAEDDASSPDASSPKDAAAMAVAAGAEKSPEEAAAESESDPAAIASIVDSVLADLRPKIFEEVSRKMGKKK